MPDQTGLRDLYRRARDTGTPLVGGHRGNPAEYPENTLSSFRSAIELGVDMIECDVHMSSDGELLVIHDHTLERTTNGTGLVFQHTAAELRDLDAGHGERLPLLREVGADIYAQHYGAMDPELVVDIHAAGGLVGVWTVDDEAAVAWCRTCHPDSVFTNRPRDLLPLLRG